MIKISLIYAVLLGIFFLVLSVRVVTLRLRAASEPQDPKGRAVRPERLERAVRGHANFAEYVPLFLVLMLIAEMNGWPPLWLHAAGSVFLAGRLAHGILFAFLGRSLLLRVGGMALTFAGYAMVLAFCLLGM